MRWVSIVYWWLVLKALRRYHLALRVLIYLGDSRTVFLGVSAAALVVAVATDFGLSAVIILPLVRFRATGRPLAVSTIAVWEGCVWLYVPLAVVMALGTILNPTSGDGVYLIKDIGHLAYWVMVQYLAVDLLFPPRKRKKVRLRVPKLALQGGVS